MITEIRHPFAHLSKDHNTVVFFEHDFDVKDEPIASWDDIYGNCTRWSIATLTRKDAIERIEEMVNEEDWELYETTEDVLQGLVT